MSIPRIRLIIMSTDNGEHETVVFTEDFDRSTDYWRTGDQTVDFDEQILVDLPSFFPFDNELDRRTL